MTEPFDKVDCVEGNVTDADLYLATNNYAGVNTGEVNKKDKSAKAFALALQSDLDDFNNYGCSQP